MTRIPTPETFVVSVRLTKMERDYLYALGGGTYERPGKSLNHILRAILTYTWHKHQKGQLGPRSAPRTPGGPPVPFGKYLSSVTVFIDERAANWDYPAGVPRPEKASDYD